MVEIYKNDSSNYIELLIYGKVVICHGVITVQNIGELVTFPEHCRPIRTIRFVINGANCTLYETGSLYFSQVTSGFFNFSYLLP